MKIDQIGLFTKSKVQRMEKLANKDSNGQMTEASSWKVQRMEK